MGTNDEIRQLRYATENLVTKVNKLRSYTEAKLTGKICLADINQLDIEYKLGKISDEEYLKERRLLVKAYKEDILKFISKV